MITPEQCRDRAAELTLAAYACKDPRVSRHLFDIAEQFRLLANHLTLTPGDCLELPPWPRLEK